MDITSALIAFGMLPSLFMILVGVGIADMMEERRATVAERATGHRCPPGTCPFCDTFGTWSE